MRHTDTTDTRDDVTDADEARRDRMYARLRPETDVDMDIDDMVFVDAATEFARVSR